jgi:hypothetical protein
MRPITCAAFFVIAGGVLMAAPAGGQAPQGWYPFVPENDTGPSVLGMDDWSPEPAGAHGRVLQQKDKLMYNGREIKLWGLNVCFGSCAPEKEIAERRAAFYRRYGINTVRLHKYAQGSGWAGIQSEGSFVKFDPAALDRMDYFIAKLKENGIYTKLSPTFGVAFGPEEYKRIPYLDELPAPEKNRIKTIHGTVWLAKEVQDFQIEQTVGLLNHTNPYTGLRYADDPAIFCVEMYNEDCVAFLYNRHLFDKPTLRGRAAARFSAWLLKRYGDEKTWRNAWGASAIVSDPTATLKSGKVKGRILPESLADGTVVPWDHNTVRGERRMLDTMEFMIGLQDEFYGRFQKACRDAGYKGAMIGSNWFTLGGDINHFYNLWSDRKVGIVDRHNYFSGGKDRIPMVDHPGAEMLSSGMMQTDDAPFMLSEWIHVFPNEWYTEGPAIIGAYGMGLNGWDVSYMFTCLGGNQGTFSPELGGAWDVMTPMILGTFPAVARFVRRMDIDQSDRTATMNICVPALREGKVSVRCTSEEQHDIKSYSSEQVPNRALAVTRVAVKFTETYEETPTFDFAPYMDGPTYVSDTKQLRWTPARDGQLRTGYFTMNTPATRGFCGFADGAQSFDLGSVRISPARGFSAIYVTARRMEAEQIEDESEVLIVGMGRGRNTGMEFNEEGNKVLDKGKGPILLEPIKAAITVPGAVSVTLLDHDGRPTDRTLPVEECAFAIDGSRDRTPYYLVKRR